MPRGARLRRLLYRLLEGPFHQWSPEVAVRYLPVVRDLERHAPGAEVVEVGSGGTGIAPYLRRPVTGVDTDFGETRSPLLRQRHGSVEDLPFGDAEVPVVVSVDMLEHVPPSLRPTAVDELVRVTSNRLVLVFPAGAAAEADDLEVARRWERRHATTFPFLEEHLTHGLPRADDVTQWVKDAADRRGRPVHVQIRGNSNALVRRLLMRIWVRQDRVAGVLLLLLNYIVPVLARIRGRSYRAMVVADFRTPGQ